MIRARVTTEKPIPRPFEIQFYQKVRPAEELKIENTGGTERTGGKEKEPRDSERFASRRE